MRFDMRFGYAVAVAALLAASPAMAQVVIGGDHDVQRHEDRADQHRQAAHEDMHAAHEKAENGNYRGAMREKAEAHEHMEASHIQQHRADHNADHQGVRVEIGR